MMKNSDQIVMYILNKIPASELGSELDVSLFSLSGDTQHSIHKMSPSDQQIKEWGLDHPSQKLLLGRYVAMKKGVSGEITLYQDNIASFFWTIIMRLIANRQQMTFELICFLCYVTVLMVYRHEQFHFFCDLNRVLLGQEDQAIQNADLFDKVFGSTSNFNETEEALAVAWSFHCAKTHWVSSTIDTPISLHIEFFSQLFDYTAPGYKDWVNYREQSCFSAGLADYLVADKAHKFLRGSGVGVGATLFNMLGGLSDEDLITRVV